MLPGNGDFANCCAIWELQCSAKDLRSKGQVYVVSAAVTDQGMIMILMYLLFYRALIQNKSTFQKGDPKENGCTGNTWL